MSVAAVILAAGSSQRLGRPKQNELIAGETLLQRAVRIANAAGLAPIIVVTRGTIPTPAIPKEKIELVINRNPDEGIASSIRCGIAALASRAVEGAVLMTCDQPAVTPSHLRALSRAVSGMTGSRYERIIGIPAYFPKPSFTDLMALAGDVGARSLLQTAHSIPAENLELDIDTQHDLDRARALFEKKPQEAS